MGGLDPPHRGDRRSLHDNLRRRRDSRRRQGRHRPALRRDRHHGAGLPGDARAHAPGRGQRSRRAHRRHGPRRRRGRRDLPVLGAVLRTQRSDQGVPQRGVRARLPARLQRLDRRLLPRAPQAAVRGGDRAATEPGARHRRARARGERAGSGSGVHPPLCLCRRAAAESHRLRSVLDGVPGPGRPGGPASRRARRHARRLPQVPAREGQRQHHRDQLRDERDLRRLGPRPCDRQRRGHNREPGTPADGRRLRALPEAARAVSGGWWRLDPQFAGTHGRAGQGVHARRTLVEDAAERVLQAAVLRGLRVRGVEPGGICGFSGRRPDPVGDGLPAPGVPPRHRLRAARVDRTPLRGCAAAHPVSERDRGLPPADRGPLRFA